MKTTSYLVVILLLMCLSAEATAQGDSQEDSRPEIQVNLNGNPRARAALESLQTRGYIQGRSVDQQTINQYIEKGITDAVQLFLDLGINPNETDRNGRLPLMIAAEAGYAEIARLLVEAGADVELTDRHGRTAEQIAYLRGHDDVVDILQHTVPKPPEWVAGDKRYFAGSDLLFLTNLYAALDDAVEKHQGDMLVYFYEPGNWSSEQIEQVVFGDPEIGPYIGDNFGLLAVAIGSTTWEQLMAEYRPVGEPADWPFVVVDIRRTMSHSGHHGWENTRSQEDRDRILTGLKFRKMAGSGM